MPLELHVDYWNSLGWADPFSSPEATARQERYAASATARGYTGDLYTPQMVVDGTRSFVGNGSLAVQAVAAAVALPKRSVHAEARPAPGGLDVELRVGAGEERPTTLFVALSEAGLSSQVTHGENRGRTLAHAPVVRILESVASVPGAGWAGSVRLAVAKGWRRENLRVVAFAQDRASGRVVGVGTAGVPEPGPRVAPSAPLH